MSISVGSLESLLLNNRVFQFCLARRCRSSFANIMHIISGVSKGLCLLPTPTVWYLIRKLNNLWNAAATPGFKGCIHLISFLCDDNMICGFPYCFWRSTIVFLQPQWALSFIKFLKNSSGSPLVYLMSYVSLLLGSSIFFSTDSWKIDMKYVKSSRFPSNGSIWTCSVDCSCTNSDSISAALLFSCTDFCCLPLLLLLSLFGSWV